MSWSNQILGEYWNLLIKRESRDIISKIIKTPDPMFKYDWLRGSLYSNILGSLNENVIFNNLMNIENLLDKGGNEKIINWNLNIESLESQDGHTDTKAYRDWRYDDIRYDYDDDQDEFIGMTNRPNHNLLHINYDDVLFEEFKWLNTDVETTDYISQRPVEMSNSFDFGDELPEIQMMFRESVDYGENIENISRYILGIDDIIMIEKWKDKKFKINQSTDKFRKYKETFKFDIEAEHVKYSNKKYNLNPLSDI